MSKRSNDHPYFVATNKNKQVRDENRYDDGVLGERSKYSKSDASKISLEISKMVPPKFPTDLPLRVPHTF